MYAIFDLDGCLSDDRWRRDRLAAGYDAYNKGCAQDIPMNLDVLARWSHCRALFLTARPDAFERPTRFFVEMICRRAAIPEYTLIMRPEGNTETSPELKAGWVVDLGLQPRDIAVAYDDRGDVLQAYRALGIQDVRKLDENGESDE